MQLGGIALETNNVTKLTDFYAKVLQLEGEGQDPHVAFPEVHLAIYNPGNIKKVKGHVERPFTLMFNVEDVDMEYGRLKGLPLDITFVTEPETKPWGMRAFTFLDPEGNKINFITVLNK